MLNIINFQTNDIYFLGDVHGRYEFILQYINDGLLDNSVLIACGDFGVDCDIHDTTNLKTLNKALNEHNITVYVVRGNHDNPEWFIVDNIYVVDFTNIVFLEDYSILRNQDLDLNILCVGGATSIDRKPRQESDWKDWWENEVFYYDECKINEIIMDLDKIDIICTHNAPSFCHPQLFSNLVYNYCNDDPSLLTDLTTERTLIDKLYEDFKYFGLQKWYYGHLHDSHVECINNIRFKLLHINEIEKYICFFVK